MNFNGKNVLVLNPHPDDGQLAAGATIAKLLENNAQIFFVLFSWIEESTLGFDIKAEFNNSIKTLGIKPNNVMNYSFKVRHFPSNRQDVLEELIKIKKDISPDLVFSPNSFDIHQDHEVINKECVRAFKHTKILGYEEPWDIVFNSKFNFFSKIEGPHLNKKIATIKCYESQKTKTFTAEEYIRALAMVRGQQSNTKYAESFEVIRWIE